MTVQTKDLWDSFWPIGVTFGGAFSLIATRKFWTFFFSVGADIFDKEQAKNEKLKRSTNHEIDLRANIELKRCYKLIDDLEADLDNLRTQHRKELNITENRGSMWEGRARRVDELAHVQKHNWMNERQRTLIAIHNFKDTTNEDLILFIKTLKVDEWVTIAKIPLLEEPLQPKKPTNENG